MSRLRQAPSPLRRLATLVLVVAAALAFSSTETGPAARRTATEPDPQVVAAVQGYAQETDKGYDHVRRWMRVLQTFGALEGMTAAEAQEYAEQHLPLRWDPVVEELSKLESGQAAPDPQVVAAVRGYAQETKNGYDHVRRWVRVLISFGVIEEMSAVEAQGYADRGWQRWVSVAAELAAMEGSASNPTTTPESGELEVSIKASPTHPKPREVTTLSAVIANAPAGSNPTYLWELDLGGSSISLGRAATASYGQSAGPASFRLTISYPGGESATSGVTVEWTETPPNQAPVLNRSAEWQFTGKVNAPRGYLISKLFTGIFSDPDGDELTYTASVPEDQRELVESLEVHLGVTGSSGELIDVLFIMVETEADWKAVRPALPDPLTIPVTLTATDPGGLSASVTGEFLTDWESHPALVSAEAGPRAVELTFDQEVRADPAPAPGQFTVNVTNEDGSTATVAVSGVSVSGKVVTLALASALQAGQTVTVDYAHDDDAPLTRAAGGGDSAPGFTGQAVEVSLADPCAGGGPPYVTSIRFESTINVDWVTPTPPENCVLTGFIVHLQGEDGTEVRRETTDPTLTSMTLQLPGPAEYLVFVYATYTVESSNTPDTSRQASAWGGTSGKQGGIFPGPRSPQTPRTASAGGLLGGFDISDLIDEDEQVRAQAGTCTVSLTLESDFDYGITGTWTGSSITCEAKTRVQHKLNARNTWFSSPLNTNTQRARMFLYGDLDPVEYDFRIEFTGTDNVVRTGTSITAMPRDDAAVTPAVGRAENVRLVMRNDNDANVFWDAPATTPTGTEVGGYHVEWREDGATGAWTRAKCTWDDGGTETSIDWLYAADKRVSAIDVCSTTGHPTTDESSRGGMIGLTTGTAYRARVVTQLVDEQTTASAALTAAATSLAVADASGISATDVIKIDNELMLVTAKSSNTLTLTRGHMNTLAAAHSSGAKVYVVTHAASAATRLPQTAMHEPLKVWYIDDTPTYNSQFGRFFMMVDGNKSNISAKCFIASNTQINCPPRTLVSLDVHPGENRELRATGTHHNGNFGNSQVMRIENVHVAHGGAQVPEKVRLSAGADRMLVSWDRAPRHTNASADAYVIETRHSNDGGSNWSDWAAAATIAKSDCVAVYRDVVSNSDRTHCEKLLTGLSHQTYQVRVRLRTLHNQLTAGRTELNVADASGITVNDVILIDNERMQVTAKSGDTLTVTRGHLSSTAANHAAPAKVYVLDSATTASAALTTSATSLAVANAGGIAANAVIQIDDERMQVTAKSGNTLTLTRGHDGTTAAAHSNGATVYLATQPTSLAQSWFLGLSSLNPTITMPTQATGRAGHVTNVLVKYPGAGKLTIEWDPPTDDGGAEVYGYVLAYRVAGSHAAPTEIEVYPRDLLRACGGNPSGCTNPRSVALTGLTSGTHYSINIAALNVNGRGLFTSTPGSPAPD